MSVRVLIVDDEAPARRKLRNHLRKIDQAEVAGEAASGPEAVEQIRRLAPDLVFLDVQMPGMTGFEVIEKIGVDAMPSVVFVTAYDQFALDAFDVQAVDYLLKPYDHKRFERAWQRARNQSDTRDPASLEALLAQGSGKFLRRIVVREDERLFFLPVREVTRFSASGNYVEVHTPSGHHLVRGTLAKLEQCLDPERFARIHRSEIVNIDWIRELRPWFHGDYVVVLKNGEELRLSRRYHDRLLRHV
jgi:two-component system, LytTR family, response regulator